MKEYWKPVIGYETLFLVSDQGNVFSMRTNKKLKPTNSSTGYLHINTRIGGRGGKAISLRVHRLVAEAFLGAHPDKPFVNHLNGLKDDNRLANLEWCTARENSLHAYRTGLATPVSRDSRQQTQLKTSDCYAIATRYKPYCKKDGARAIGREYGLPHATIMRAVRYMENLAFHRPCHTKESL